MVIVSQFKDNTTESIELKIITQKSPKPVIIPKEKYEEFRKKTIKRKNDNTLSLIDLKVLEKLMKTELLRNVYMLIEVNSGRNLGTYLTEKRAKEELQEILKAFEHQRIYQIHEDEKMEFERFL